MKKFLLPLMSIILCASTPHSASIDPGADQPKPDKEMHAAVTDIPDIIDLSYADPKTWHSLPPVAQVYDQVLAPENQFAIRVSGRPRPF